MKKKNTNWQEEQIRSIWYDINNPRIINIIENCLASGENIPPWISHKFYDAVVRMKPLDTKWQTFDAVGSKGTLDHFISPRLLFRAAVDESMKYITNYSLFKEMIYTCLKVIKTTSEQNQQVKYENRNNEIIVNELTIYKYDTFGFYNEETNTSSDEFPLKEFIPNYLTKYEEKHMRVEKKINLTHTLDQYLQ